MQPMKFVTWLLSAALALLVTVLAASPALALVQKSGGSFSCGPDQRVRINAKGQGTIKIYINNLQRSEVTLSTIQPTYYQYQSRSISTWKVTSNDILVDSGTGPDCVP